MTGSPASPLSVPGAEPDIAIGRPLRAWLVVEVFFGLTAILSAFLRPEDTAATFAWPITPVVMAAVFGAFYVAAGSLFVLGLFVRRWQSLRVIVIPSVAFTAVMLLTTFLHWDKFSHGSLPFRIWFASYLLPPPIFLWLYRQQQRGRATAGAGAERPLPSAARRFLRVNGWALTGLALVGYLMPSLLQALAPWSLTPLTARTLCGWLVALGLLQVWMDREGEWSRLRLGTAMLLILPIALAIQLGRFADQVRWTSPALWLMLADVAASGLLSLRLWLQPGSRQAGA
ncbi:MAG: hypothetical protein KDH92_05380 [Chloroflexi bacterium]|nr:hypothetical protein [Chloroflexota bacterium]